MTSRRAHDDGGTPITPGNSGIASNPSPPTSGTWEREAIAREVRIIATLARNIRLYAASARHERIEEIIRDGTDAIMALAVGGGDKGSSVDESKRTGTPSPPTTDQHSAGQSDLDRVWRAVDVLGAPDTACTTDEEHAYCRAIGDALREIEKLGGRWS